MTRNDALEILRRFKREHGEEYGIVEIGVFGSVARGEANDNSDIDICVRTKTPDPFQMVHIKEALESLVHRHVDIVRIRDAMNPYLRARIEQEGIYV